MRWRLAVAGIVLSGGVGGYLVGEGAPWLVCLADMALVGPWWVRRRPALAADGTAFTAVASSWYAGLFAGLLALTVSGARLGLATESGRSAAMFGVLAVIAIALAVPVAWRRPSLSLTPKGVVRFGPRGSRQTPWEEIGLPVRVTQLGQTMSWGDSGKASVRWFTTEAAFIAAAITHYRLHPEHRAAIGTPEEHQRLRRALRVV